MSSSFFGARGPIGAPRGRYPQQQTGYQAQDTENHGEGIVVPGAQSNFAASRFEDPLNNATRLFPAQPVSQPEPPVTTGIGGVGKVRAAGSKAQLARRSVEIPQERSIPGLPEPGESESYGPPRVQSEKLGGTGERFVGGRTSQPDLPRIQRNQAIEVLPGARGSTNRKASGVVTGEGPQQPPSRVTAYQRFNSSYEEKPSVQTVQERQERRKEGDVAPDIVKYGGEGLLQQLTSRESPAQRPFEGPLVEPGRNRNEGRAFLNTDSDTLEARKRRSDADYGDPSENTVTRASAKLIGKPIRNEYDYTLPRKGYKPSGFQNLAGDPRAATPEATPRAKAAGIQGGTWTDSKSDNVQTTIKMPWAEPNGQVGWRNVDPSQVVETINRNAGDGSIAPIRVNDSKIIEPDSAQTSETFYELTAGEALRGIRDTNRTPLISRDALNYAQQNTIAGQEGRRARRATPAEQKGTLVGFMRSTGRAKEGPQKGRMVQGQNIEGIYDANGKVTIDREVPDGLFGIARTEQQGFRRGNPLGNNYDQIREDLNQPLQPGYKPQADDQIKTPLVSGMGTVPERRAHRVRLATLDQLQQQGAQFFAVEKQVIDDGTGRTRVVENMVPVGGWREAWRSYEAPAASPSARDYKVQSDETADSRGYIMDQPAETGALQKGLPLWPTAVKNPKAVAEALQAVSAADLQRATTSGAEGQLELFPTSRGISIAAVQRRPGEAPIPLRAVVDDNGETHILMGDNQGSRYVGPAIFSPDESQRRNKAEAMGGNASEQMADFIASSGSGGRDVKVGYSGGAGTIAEVVGRNNSLLASAAKARAEGREVKRDGIDPARLKEALLASARNSTGLEAIQQGIRSQQPVTRADGFNNLDDPEVIALRQQALAIADSLPANVDAVTLASIAPPGTYQRQFLDEALAQRSGQDPYTSAKPNREIALWSGGREAGVDPYAVDRLNAWVQGDVSGALAESDDVIRRALADEAEQYVNTSNDQVREQDDLEEELGSKNFWGDFGAQSAAGSSSRNVTDVVMPAAGIAPEELPRAAFEYAQALTGGRNPEVAARIAETALTNTQGAVQGRLGDGIDVFRNIEKIAGLNPQYVDYALQFTGDGNFGRAATIVDTAQRSAAGAPGQPVAPAAVLNAIEQLSGGQVGSGYDSFSRGKQIAYQRTAEPYRAAAPGMRDIDYSKYATILGNPEDPNFEKAMTFAAERMRRLREAR